MLEFKRSLFLPDLHLRHKDRIWTNRADVVGDGATAVASVLENIEANEVDMLFLAGDVCDTALHRSDVIALLSRLVRGAIERGATVLFVQGQHEMGTPPIVLATCPEAVHAHGLEFKIGDKLCYGLDYQSPSKVSEALKAVPLATDYLFTHQVWKEFMGEDRGYATVVDCQAGTIYTGDFHRKLEVLIGSQTLVSCGPPHMQGWGEGRDNVCLLIESGGHTEIELRGRTFLDYAVTDGEESSLQSLRSALNAETARASELPPVVRVAVTNDGAPRVRAFFEAEYPGVPLFVKLVAPRVTDTGHEDTVERVVADLSTGSVILELAEGVQAYQDTMTIMTSNDSLAQAQAILDEEVGGTNEV